MDVTLITGASGGIGEAFARRLAALQHNLLLVARSEPKLQALCAELTQQHGITAQYVALDLAGADADQRLFAETGRRNLRVNWLINNAGIGSVGDFARLDLGSERAMIALNVTTLVALTHRYLQPMRERGHGTIINVASLAGFLPSPYLAVYAASKAFVRSFTEAIAEENRPHGIRVLLLNPGATETNFFDAARLGAENKGDIGVTSLETPDQVVDTALNALRRRKTSAISGFRNRLLIGLGRFVPGSLFTRLTARQVRVSFAKRGKPLY